MNITRIDNRLALLAQVKKLWRADSGTLGFFPNEAFAEYATRKQILVAIDADGTCMGYLLYRLSRMRVVIVHLCVAPSQRRKGVAKALVGYLREITREFRGISLHCRRDFDANKIWPELGFVALHEKLGRSGLSLTYWWLDYGHPSLISIAGDTAIRSRIKATIDSNVFFDILDDSRLGSEESKSLMADWLQDEVAVCLTQEVLNDIHKHPDPVRRKREREYAQLFPVLEASDNEVEMEVEKLRRLFPVKDKGEEESDIRHLARAVAAGAQFFVTHDKPLLRIANKALALTGLSIVRPCDLVVHLDALLRQAEYQPARMAGSLMQFSRVQPKQESILADAFAQQESRSAFLNRLYTFLSAPQRYETLAVRDAASHLLALVVYERQSSSELRIPLFRVMRSTLSPTLAGFLALSSVQTAVRESRTVTKITDPHLSETSTNALENSPFVYVGECWVKFNLSACETAKALAEKLGIITTETPLEQEYLHSLARKIEEASSARDTRVLLDAEHLLWPAKILDIDVPCFIVPIKPQWALHLFDERMAKQTLFGADPDVALNGEHVYYRAKNPRVLSAPGRILWYVSGDASYPGSKSVRACSRLEHVSLGKPKELYKQFRRLGIYEWKDIYDVARRDTAREIMAVRFSDTQLFDAPIPWQALQEVLMQEQGHNSQIQSPIQLSSRCFRELYRRGIRTGLGPI